MHLKIGGLNGGVVGEVEAQLVWQHDGTLQKIDREVLMRPCNSRPKDGMGALCLAICCADMHCVQCSAMQ